MKDKSKIAIMLISIFVFGLLIGFIFHAAVPMRSFPFCGPPRHFKHHKKPLSERFGNVFTKRIINEIDPNDDQKEEVTAIVKKHEERFVKNNDEHMKEMISLFRDMERELKPILNENQKLEIREKLDRMENGFKLHSRHPEQ